MTTLAEMTDEETRDFSGNVYLVLSRVIREVIRLNPEAEGLESCLVLEVLQDLYATGTNRITLDEALSNVKEDLDAE